MQHETIEQSIWWLATAYYAQTVPCSFTFVQTSKTGLRGLLSELCDRVLHLNEYCTFQSAREHKNA